MQEDVGDADDGQHDHQVEELAQHEAPEVDPEPALNVLGEILKKTLFIAEVERAPMYWA